jgi:hypothetical protein
MDRGSSSADRRSSSTDRDSSSADRRVTLMRRIDDQAHDLSLATINGPFTRARNRSERPMNVPVPIGLTNSVSPFEQCVMVLVDIAKRGRFFRTDGYVMTPHNSIGYVYTKGVKAVDFI